MVERFMVTCTCDDIGDKPCPMHARENALQDEVVGLRNSFAAIACRLGEFWSWRKAEARRTEKATHESAEGEAIETLRAVGRIVERQAFALVEQGAVGANGKRAAETMARMRQTVGGSPFGTDDKGKGAAPEDRGEEGSPECSACGGDEYVQPCHECGGGMTPGEQLAAWDDAAIRLARGYDRTSRLLSYFWTLHHEGRDEEAIRTLQTIGELLVELQGARQQIRPEGFEGQGGE